MSPTEWVDDGTIPDGTPLWRRIHPSQIKTDPRTGDPIVSDSMYRTHQMSVHIAPLTDPQSVLANYPNHKLSQFTAGDARAEGCIVVRDPLPEDPSHAIVCRNDGHDKRISGSQAKRIAARARLVVLITPDERPAAPVE